jgi:hypothetical protein
VLYKSTTTGNSLSYAIANYYFIMGGLLYSIMNKSALDVVWMFMFHGT